MGGSFGVSELGEGWLSLGLGVTYSRRNQMHQGDERVMNMENESTSARVYTVEGSLGIWKGLSFGLTFTLLDVTATEDESGKVGDLAIGDIQLMLSYQRRSESYSPAW